MDLNRKELLTALQTAEPALATRDLLPLLQQIWFTGSYVRATDGLIGIEAPLKTDFAGGVPGKVLIGFVSSLNSETIKATPDDDTLTFSSGRARIKLPLEGYENLVWPFRVENAPPKTVLPLSKDWRTALEFSMLSVTNNSTNDEHRGVTFEADDPNTVNLYASDNMTIAWAKMKVEDWASERFTVPGDFLTQVLKLPEDAAPPPPAETGKKTRKKLSEAEPATGNQLLLHDAQIQAVGSNGVGIYSRMFHVENPLNYRNVVKRHTPKESLVPFPDGMKEALERVELLKEDKDGVRAQFTFTDEDILVVEGSSSLGDLKEELYLEDGSKHKEITSKYTPSLLLRGIEGREKFVVTDRCIMLTGPENLTYFVASYGKK